MRRIVGILRLLCNQSWIELLVAIDVSWVDILRRLAVGLLGSLVSLNLTQM